MKNEIVVTTENTVMTFSESMKIAQVYANSDLVPAHFRKIENAFIALQMAGRMEIDPFLLMQNLYVVHGKPGIEAKLAIALVNQSGLFGPLRYDLTGEGENRGCRVVTTLRETGEEVAGPVVTIKMANDEGWASKSGSKWKTLPELMLMYRAATFFIRLFAPQVLMGMQTKEEIQDAIPVERVEETSEHEPYDEHPEKLEINPKKKPEPQKEFAPPNVCQNKECPAYVEIGSGEATKSRCSDPGHTNDGKDYVKTGSCNDFVATKSPNAVLGKFDQKLIDAAKKSLGIAEAKTPEEKWKTYDAILGSYGGLI